jgi:hypothetical protein
MKAINSRGAKMVGLIERLDEAIEWYDEREEPWDTQNLVAFQDEGELEYLELAKYIHAHVQPPDELETITRSWLARERKLYLDSKNPDRAMEGQLGGAIRAYNRHQESITPEKLVEMINNNEFDYFAALVPTLDEFFIVNELISRSAEHGMDQPPEYNFHPAMMAG